MKKKHIIPYIAIIFVHFNLNAQDYFITETANNKKEVFNYYFNVMDSLVTANQNDTAFSCVNCVRFMEGETKIYSSAKTTFFGRLYFTKPDLLNWHNWYKKNFFAK